MSYLGKGIRGGTTPFSVIDIFTGLQKRMEAVYGGDGEKLAVRFFDNDTVSSAIYYNGAFTYVSQGSNPAARTLRDMSTPEGVVTKSGGNYYYKYFLRDYLGNVRDVLSCSKSGGYQEEQFTNYDPLGQAISKIGGDNPYLYNGKELYTDFSDAYEGVYDFGARYYNPLYGRWFAQDPEKQFINPYLYCANNPILFVDPDGRKIDPKIFRDLISWLRLNKSIYEDRNSELESNMNGSNNKRKITKMKKEYDENEEYINEFEELEEILCKMDADPVNFIFNKSNVQAKSVYQNTDNNVVIQYSTLGEAFHEVRHIGQGYDAGGLKFEETGKVRGLLYAVSSDSGMSERIKDKQMTSYEVDAYRSQFMADKRLAFVTDWGNGIMVINKIDDITPHSIANIFVEKDGRYVKAYEFAR